MGQGATFCLPLQRARAGMGMLSDEVADSVPESGVIHSLIVKRSKKCSILRRA